MSEESITQQAREIVRHIRAGTITYNTEDDAVAPIDTLIKKREFEVMRELIQALSTLLIDYPMTDENWARNLVGDMSVMFAKLLQSCGEME